MRYRVYFKIEYCEAAFDFDTMEDAGKFADSILKHKVPDEKGRRQSVRIIILGEGEEEDD